MSAIGGKADMRPTPKGLPDCRIYRLDKNGRIEIPDEVIYCGTDRHAIENAKQMVGGHDIEVRQRSRRVIELKKF